MKAKWQTLKLGDVCDFEGGSQPPKSEFIYEPKPNYVRFLQIRDFGSDKNITYIPEAKKNRKCVEDDILIGRYGASVGKILTNKSGAYNVALMKTIPDSTLLTRSWFFNYLISDEFQNELLNVAERSAQAGFSKDDIYNFPILVPSISEQQRIVAMLDQAFEGIAKARANAQQNLQNARALFESHLQSVFNQRGEGWVEKTLSAVCEIKPPKSEAKKLLKNSDLVSFAPMEDLGINQKYLKPKKQRTLEDVAGSYTYFAEGDVLLAKITPCFENGKLGIAKNLINGIGFGSSEYIVFRPNKELSNEFLYYFLSRKRFIEEGAVRMSGAVGHKRVSKEFIEEYKVAFPSLDTQNMMVKKIDNLSKETQRLETLYQRKINLLDELKKSLLQQAFAGEL